MFDATTVPEERFPPLTAQVLRAVGWSPGRDIGDLAEQMLERAVETARVRGYEIEAFAAVRAAIHKFGGLEVTHERSGIGYPGDDFRIDPTRAFADYRHFAHVVGRRVFPLAVELREGSVLLMAENGEVYFLHMSADFYAGADIDSALQTLIETAGPMTDLWEYYEMDVVEESGWRFNDRTTPILLGAGWTIGRDLGAEADEMVARTIAGAAELGHELEPFRAAVAAIHEFGGLTFTKAALEDETGFDGTDLRLDPSAVLDVLRTGRVLERTLSRRCFPLGRDLDYDFAVWIDSDGGVYEVYKDGDLIHLVGETVDEAVTRWLLDHPFDEISLPTDESDG